MRLGDELSPRALQPDDVAVLGWWLRQPELGYESDEPNDDNSVGGRYLPGADDRRSQWIITHTGTAVGYFQWYPAYAPFWQDLHGYSSAERLYGFDIFIGDLERQGRGLGRRVVSGAAAHLLQREATVVIVDVAETNERAIMCYRSAGFNDVRHLDGEDGPSVLLERRNWSPDSSNASRRPHRGG